MAAILNIVFGYNLAADSLTTKATRYWLNGQLIPHVVVKTKN